MFVTRDTRIIELSLTEVMLINVTALGATAGVKNTLKKKLGVSKSRNKWRLS